MTVQARQGSDAKDESGHELDRFEVRPRAPIPAEEHAAVLERAHDHVAAGGARGGRERPDRGERPFAALAVERQGDAKERERDRNDVRQEPGRREHCRVPVDRAEGEKDGCQCGYGATIRQPSGHAPRQCHVDRAEKDTEQLRVRGQAEDGHERRQQDRRQRRERQQRVRRFAGQRPAAA